MAKVDLLIKEAKELITLSGPNSPRCGEDLEKLGIIEDGSVAIDDGRIVEVGRNLKLSAKTVIDAKNKTVIPGFVDPHTHLVFGGSREFEFDWKLQGLSYMQIKDRGGGIGYTVRKTREASAEELYAQAAGRLKRMLNCGTTTCEAKTGYGLDTKTELKLLEVAERLREDFPADIVMTFLGAHDVPKGSTVDDYLDLVIDEMLPAVKNRVSFCDVFCEQGVFSLDQSKRLLTKAKKLGMGLKIHADEIVQTGGAGLAADLGAISADHLLRSSEQDMKKMAKKGTIGVLLPGTPFALRMKEYAPAEKLIESGVPIALATDLNPNCWVENMQFMIQLACFNMGLTPAQALTAATFNSACAIGMQDEVGSLEVGKKADCVILDAPNYRFLPYHFGVNLAETVIKSGRIVANTDIKK